MGSVVRLIVPPPEPPRQAVPRRRVARAPWWSALWLPPLAMATAVLMVWSAVLLRWLVG